MSFSYSSSRLPGNLHSYAAVQRHWDAVKPWRGDGEFDWRPLETKRRRHVCFRKNERTGDFELKYHNTVIAIYHAPKPGEQVQVSIDTYSSMSTQEFASNLMPHGMACHMTFTLGPVIWCGVEPARGYNITDPTRFEDRGDGDWWPVEKPDPWRSYEIDKEAAKAALMLHPYADFRDWFLGYKALGGHAPAKKKVFGQSRSNAIGVDYQLTLLPRDILSQLSGERSRWPEMLTHMSADPVRDARNAIYTVHGCAHRIEVPYFEGSKHQEQVVRARKAYASMCGY